MTPPPAAVLCGVLAAGLLASPARADDPELFDADGDGDVDAGDAAILRSAERVEIVDKSDAQKQRESARAITVIETRQARERSADLGEVLSRTEGVQVRRSGGLGSDARFSLNGLYDEQIRFFLDGVPLRFAGLGLGVANVPVELVQRIEVHRGVVPIALGADALGGAIDLVTDPSWVNRAAASYEVGSFGTHRATTTARAHDAGTGVALGLGLFFDRAKNDYLVDVEAPDDEGQPQPVRVRRFHDAYTAAGGSVEAGLVDRGALRRALVRLYATDYDKELQHNVVMTVPYGEATYGERARGATADVEVARGAWQARVLAGAARRSIDFDDRAQVVYDWYGRQGRPRRMPGELGTEPTYQRVDETGLFGRASGELAIDPHHALRAMIAPTASRRSGEDFLDPNPGGRDPLSARRDLTQLVSGIEHELRLFGGRLHNIGFVKHYAMWTAAEDVRPGFVFVPLETRTQRFGIGDAVRYAVSPELAVKASYERATRLPSVDEVFGDGLLVSPNLALAPETSHNLNLGARYEAAGPRGELTAEASLFARLADQLIALLGDDRDFLYQNVYSARILGVDGTGGWSAPGGWARLEGSVTVQDIRNASSTGQFSAFEGDRIPNRPWLLGALAGTLRSRGLVRDGDELVAFASSRYVHEFFRSWESAGLPQFKQRVPSQLVHSAGVTYALRGKAAIATTVELQNLTDASAFDSFGVQRPGRALYVKVSAEL